MRSTTIDLAAEPFGSNVFQLWRGLRCSARVILALIIREMKIRYGRSRLGYAMAFVSPAVQKGILISLMVVYDRHAPIGPSPILFYWAALSSYHMFGFTISKCMLSIKEARKVRALPVIRPPDLVFARAILEGSTNVVVNTVGFVAIYMFDTELAMPGAPIYVMESMILMFMFGVGVSFFNGVICVFFPTFQYIWRSISIVLMLGSGVFRVADSLPPNIRAVMAWNPLAHGIELFRLGFYPFYPDDFIDVPYLALWACSTLVIGIALERVLRYRIATHR